MTRSIDHLYTRLESKSNYNAIADLHTLQIATSHTKPQSFIIFPGRWLVTAHKWRFLSFCAHAFARWLILLTSELIIPTVLVITSRHGPHGKHIVSNSNSICICVFFAARADHSPPVSAEVKKM
jgi:hypothetical protein